MNIKVRTLTGKEMEIDVGEQSTATVEIVKYKIFEKEGISVDQQRIIYGGKQLQDKNLLSDYNIEPGSSLHIVFALRGGRM